MKIMFLGFLTIFNLLITQQVKAEIIPDRSLNTEISSENGLLLIKGGERSGENLFHSFREFNVREGQEVYFTNPENISNIFSRITGNNPSQILGTLGVTGQANLYLINTNGIIFGPNSTLDVKGSFVGTTANNILFADGFRFETKISPTERPLLTISVPIGLGFLDSKGVIINQSEIGLGVPNQQTIALVGGRISFRGGFIETESANIELGSVNQGIVNILHQGESFTLDYQNVESFRDVTIANFAGVFSYGENTGNINIQARNISIRDSQIGTTTYEGKAGNLIVKGINNIEISGYIGDDTPSGIIGTTEEQASGEDTVIRVEARRLSLTDGSQILADNYSDRPGITVIINVVESIDIIGNSPDKVLPSAISSTSDSTGNAGNLTINTSRLTLVDGANLSSSSFAGIGKAGDLTINATEINVIGFNINELGEERPTGIFAQVETESFGDGGNLRIQTNRLTVQNGGQISTSTKNRGQGGDMIITATEFIHLEGTSPEADLVLGQSGIFTSAEKSELREGGEILASTGDAGNLFLKTPELIITEGAKISADTFGLGQGGNIVIEVDNLIISQGGSLRAGSFVEADGVIPGRERGDGGTISIKATEGVRVTRSGTTGEINPIPINSNITSESQGTGNAGGIVIISPEIFIDNQGIVSVSNSGEGEGGNLEISTNSLSLSQGTISAATSQNQGGNLTLLVTDTIFLERNSQITATAGIETGKGDGGNITIDTGFLIATPQENNDIIANASLGRGGNIQITALGVLGITPRPQLTPLSDINASSEFGIDGIVSITTPEADPEAGIIRLSEEVINIEWLKAQNPCTVEEGIIAKGSSLIITGRGGFPPSSHEAIAPRQRIVPWQSLETPKSPVQIKPRETESIPTPQSIQGWFMTADGTIHLSQNITRYSYLCSMFGE
ncbi:MAG: filamentous hemagglutinin N-terminal domain-containing protein [Gloeocapsa sp. DLM2.Bin57]|nr:MAG: filamentous hemagglutinin N-terminal domain-containing protein [Gloeocapsa sp. DLM2.Bin57]